MSKLHLGCGNKRLDGFVNIDVRESEEVDVVDDITTLEKFEENSVNLIYVSHVAEHIPRLKNKKVFKRWHDLLVTGGGLRIAVPNFEAIVDYYNQFKDLKVLMGLLYGGQTYPQNYHYCTWDFKTLSEDLAQVGFKNVKKYDWRLTEHAVVDDYSQCYLPHLDKENGMLMSLNVEATK